MESPTTLCATTLMVYTVPLCSPLSTVLVAVAGSSSGVEPLLGTAVTVYPVTGGLLSGSVGEVHVTVMDEPEVAVAVTPPGEGGAGWGERVKRCWKDDGYKLMTADVARCRMEWRLTR